MATSDARTVITVAQLGELQSSDAWNACNLANQTQSAFEYTWIPKALNVNKTKYTLPNGGFDLTCALGDLSASKKLPRPLVLLTSLPLSSPEDGNDPDGLVFCVPVPTPRHDTFIVSTYVWENVLGRKNLLQSYLIFMMAGLALQIYSRLAWHEETRGCYFDMCQKTEDFGEAFRTMSGVCAHCETKLAEKIDDRRLRVEQVAAARKLFNRAFHKKVCFLAIPFEREIQSVYKMIVKALAQEEWTMIRADRVTKPRGSADRILLSILSSDLILADLTGNNPNVFYELGWARALGLDRILLTQHQNQLPFDVRDETVVPYVNSDTGRKKLSKDVTLLAGKGAW
ncbi:MAG TPA: hypothetical protein VGM86_03400 [Thermoanaerobaculia bacterium]|jgi:hypothetical protein